MYVEQCICNVPPVVHLPCRLTAATAAGGFATERQRLQQIWIYSGYVESAEQSRMAEQNKISKLTVKLQIISTEHGCRM